MKKIVLTGGCFDVLHPGHVAFLEKAKKAGDKLIILLESDEKVRMLKGKNRPIHTQKDRVKILRAIRYVDQVISLPFMDNEAEYDKLIAKIKPDIIAATKGYPKNYHQRAANNAGARLKYVIKVKGNYSTTGILKKNLV